MVMAIDRRLWILLGAAALVLIGVGVAAYLALPSEPVESSYGYTVSVSTDSTLGAVTLLLPIPVAEGDGLVVNAITQGRAETPDGWDVSVVDTEFGPMLRIHAAAMPAQRQPDGRTYSTYGVSLSVASPVEIDTKAPFGEEPLLRPRIEQRERPCPNQAGPEPEETCFSYESRVFANYTAPADAEVDVYIVAGGTNDLTGAGRQFNRYYDRVTVFLDGPQSGWVEAEGFASTGVGTYSRFDPLTSRTVNSEILIPAD